MRSFDDTEKQLEQLLHAVEELSAQLISNHNRINEMMLEILPRLDANAPETRNVKLAWEDVQNHFGIVCNTQTPEFESTLEKRLRLLRVFLDEF